MKPIRFCQSALQLAAALLVLNSTAQAQNTSTASLSDLRFQLIDLNPNDGIAPGVTWGGNLSTWNMGPLVPSGEVDAEGGVIWTELSSPLLPTSQLQSGSRTWLAPELNGQTLTGSIGQGQVSAGVSNDAESLRAGVAMTEFQTDALVASGWDINPETGVLTYYNDLQPQIGVSYFDSTFQQLRGESTDETTAPTLTLTPGTLLVLTGKINSSLRVDVASFRDIALGVIGEDFAGYADGSVNTSVRLELSGVQFGEGGELAGGSVNQYLFTKGMNAGIAFDVNGAFVELPEGEDPLTYGTTLDRSESFAFSIDNLGSQELVLNMNLGIEANATFSVSGYRNSGDVVRVWGDQVIPTAPVIPEPGTWALMGLGLAGVAMARRRQARSRAAQPALA